jgi:branched-chain amino acid transport system permease protein
MALRRVSANGAAPRPAATPRPVPVRLLGAAVPWLVLAAGIALPALFDTGFELTRYELLLLYVTVAIALNFAFGFAGELALGQPVLVAAAAYTAGLLSSKWNWQFLQTLGPAVAAAVVASVVLALPSLRVRGWYFAVISFFAIAVLPDVLEAFAPVTGGNSGLTGINPIAIGGRMLPPWGVYEVILATAALAWVGARNLVVSDWGIVLRGMRDHPVAASASGVNLHVTRAWVYVLLAIPCGVAGAEFAHSQLYLTPSNFAFGMILLLIGGVFLGGLGTLWGPVLGIAVFEGISFWIGPFSGLNQVFLGAGVLVAALGFKGGIVATAGRWYARLSGRATVRHVSDAEVELAMAGEVPLPPVENGPSGVGVSSVWKSFGGTVALAGVDLELRPGRVLALIGPNGSGKTTLLNLISGYVRPDRGRILVNGTDVSGLPPHRRARLGLGRTFQVPRLVDELTVVENVQLGLVGRRRQRVLEGLFRVPWQRRLERLSRKRAREVCRFLGFTDALMAAPARSLPLGLKRIAEIGRAVVSGAPVVCLDEPAAGLTQAERDRLAAVLRSLAAAGRAVLLVEHNTRFVLAACDELVLLRDGRVAGRGAGARRQDMEPELRDYVAAYAGMTGGAAR